MQSITTNLADRPCKRTGLPSLRADFEGLETWAPGSRFLLLHLWLPLAAFAGSSILLIGLHGDQWWADRLYAWEGHAWALQSGYVTQTLLHAGARQASKIAWYLALLVMLASLLDPRRMHWRRPLVYLLVSTLLATVVVAWMKRWTDVDCPWDLLRYGGDKDLYGLFAGRPPASARGSCFPAGHASAGYAWVALYFFLRATRPRWRHWGLGVGLGLGLVFGVAQQLRGAHFASHDLWSLMICWLVALSLYRVMLARRPFPHPARSGS